MVQQQSSFFKSLFQEKGQVKSYIFVILSCFTWVGGYVYGNQHKFSPIETNFSRAIVTVFGTYIICRYMGLDITYKNPKTWNTLIKRHLAFILEGLVIAGVQFILPLGVAHTIASSGPILVLLMQKFFFKNSQSVITAKKIEGCIIAIIGIVLTSNGKLIYGYMDESFEFNSTFNYTSSSPTVMILATVVLIIAMSIWAYGVLITQEAECHAFEIVFHFSVMNFLINAFLYIFIEEKRPADEIYVSFLWTGFCLFLSEITFTLALNLSQNMGLTNVTTFSVVVVGYGISIIRYGESLDAVSLIGTVLVLGGVSLVILSKTPPQQNPSQGSNQLKQVLNNKQDTIQQVEHQKS